MKVSQAFEDAFDDNDQGVRRDQRVCLKSTGRVIDITLDVVFDYKQLLTDAILRQQLFT